jgi:hypothetical protein
VVNEARAWEGRLHFVVADDRRAEGLLFGIEP